LDEKLDFTSSDFFKEFLCGISIFLTVAEEVLG